jgi:hypothetical protein
MAEVEFRGMVSGAQQVAMMVMVVLPTGAKSRHHRQPIADVHGIVAGIVITPSAEATVMGPIVLNHIHP